MRVDLDTQRAYFKQVLTATVQAALVSSSSELNMGRIMELYKRPGFNAEVFKTICLEDCVYKIRFPRQIGKSTIVKEFVEENPVLLLSPEMVIWKSIENSPFLFDPFSDFIQSELHKTKWVILIDTTEEETAKLLDSTIEMFINANSKIMNNDLVFPYFIIIQ